jgi:GSH-dependent disulfide-bond oxidoreductase
MIELYYWPTPNGHKITMFLEEAGLPYRIHPVDISAGDQFKPEFFRISPNNRRPRGQRVGAAKARSPPQ